MQCQNQYLHYLMDPSFQEVNGIFILLFSDGTDRTGNRRYTNRRLQC